MVSSVLGHHRKPEQSWSPGDRQPLILVLEKMHADEVDFVLGQLSASILEWVIDEGASRSGP